MYSKVFLHTLENDDKVKQIYEYITQTYKARVETTNSLEKVTTFNDGTLHLLYLSDKNTKIFFKENIQSDIHIGLIYHEDNANVISNYSISKNLEESIEDAFNEELLSKIDLLKCNNKIAINRVSIGDMHGMNRLDYNKNTRFQKFKIFYNNLISLSFRNYTLTTSKEHSIQTVASGITVLEHSTKTSQESAIRDDLSIHDGKLNAYILAPTSLLSYIWYLIAIFFYQKISLVSLPKSLGFIKSTKLTISSNEVVDYKIDNNQVYQANNIELEVVQNSIQVHLGRNLIDIVKSDNDSIKEKDSIKVDSLPKGEIKDILIQGKLPFFKKASDEDFKELLVSLKDSANLSYTFLILMVLSTLLATTGLFANSAPVIIGAMILAPLMAPIISLSMGVIRTDNYLFSKSIYTLSLGILTALFFSCIFTWFIPLEQITPEMQGRVHPNLLDLMVAIISGIAGAYATSKEQIAKSLAGVAIAVALVPPLSVTGIGLGLGDFDVVYGSFLLFITNLVGITLSAAITFIILGFAPVTKAKKGIFYTTVLMAIVSIPLFLSFMKVVDRYDYFKQLNEIKSISVNEKIVELTIKSIQNRSDILDVSLEASSNKPLNQNDYSILKQKLQENVDKKLKLKIVPIVVIQ